MEYAVEVDAVERVIKVCADSCAEACAKAVERYIDEMHGDDVYVLIRRESGDADDAHEGDAWAIVGQLSLL